ncbi:MAG TPA: hypothetical protein VFQ47_03095, partial [Nitrososphaera sp.]|nr:hypothetical protein [Nitrososphaera sp.]
ISQLRVQVRDVSALERGMDSIRREIISPVRQELEHSAKIGQFSVWGFWVGLIGGVLAIISIVLGLAQWLESKRQVSLQPKDVPSYVQSTATPQVQDQRADEFNAPESFSTDHGYSSSATSPKEWKRIGQNYIEIDHGRKVEDFQFTDRIIYENCRGSLLYNIRIGSRDIELYVPDKGCPTMKAMTRKDKGAWTIIGEMRNIQ